MLISIVKCLKYIEKQKQHLCQVIILVYTAFIISVRIITAHSWTYDQIDVFLLTQDKSKRGNVLGVAPAGLHIYSEHRLVQAYSWSEIKNVSYRDRKVSDRNDLSFCKRAPFGRNGHFFSWTGALSLAFTIGTPYLSGHRRCCCFQCDRSQILPCAGFICWGPVTGLFPA